MFEPRLFCCSCLLVLLGCSKHPASDPQAGAAASASPKPAAAPSASAGSAAVTSDAPPLPAGCFDSLTAETPDALLKQIGERCSPGMQTLWSAPRAVKVQAGEPTRVSFKLEDPSRCLRAAAIGAPDARLTLKLLSPDGVVISTATLDARLGVLNPGGPICVERAGEYQLAVELAAAGDVLLQGWLPSAEQGAPSTPR